MTQPSNPRGLAANAEKIIIGLLFFSIVLYYIVGTYDDMKTGIFYFFVLAMQSVILLYYIYLTKNIYSLVLIGFIVLNIGIYLQVTGNAALGKSLVLAGQLSEFAFGLFLAYKTFNESKKNNDWEMFGTLLTVGLIYPFVSNFLPVGKEILVVYYFAFAFIIGTVIYNENLWDKYNASEKKILTYVLVITVVEVLFISLRLL